VGAAAFAIAFAAAGRRGSEGALQLSRGVHPSVILISVDTLRADRLSVYGYGRRTSPALERLASSALVFDHFYYSGGGTLPSHMTMMTSLNPATHGIHPGSGKSLEPERLTLAEVLREKGYRTAAYTDGGWMAAKFGFDQGFDVFDESNHGLRKSLPKAKAWLDRQLERPAFLFLHTYDVHSKWEKLPYDCPGETELAFVESETRTFDGCRGDYCASRLLSWLNGEITAGRQATFDTISEAESRFVSTLYDGCIRYVDGELEGLFDHLKATRRYDDSLIVVTSDHGEEFGEHGLWLHDQGGYEELSHIPLLIKLPGGRLAGTRVDAMGAMVDLMPTILHAVRMMVPEQAQGRNLLNFAPGAARSSLHMYSVLRTERFKYFSDERRLFDLIADPLELTNIFAADRNLARRLEHEVRGLVDLDTKAAEAFARGTATGSRIELTPEEIQRLRALGYLR